MNTQLANRAIRRRGRPSLKDEQFRGFGVKIHFSDNEWQKLNELANIVDRSSNPKRLADYIRRTALQERFNHIPKINRSVVMELNSIGINLNQMTKAANSGIQIDQELLLKMNEKLGEIAERLYITTD